MFDPFAFKEVLAVEVDAVCIGVVLVFKLREEGF